MRRPATLSARPALLVLLPSPLAGLHQTDGAGPCAAGSVDACPGDALRHGAQRGGARTGGP